MAYNQGTRGKFKVGSLYASTLALAGTLLTGTATVFNRITTAFGTVTFDRVPKIATVTLTGVVATTGGGVGGWTNPEAGSIMIKRVLVNITTKSTGAANLAVGSTATNITTSSNNLLDALDVGTAAVLADNITDKGSAGKSRQLLATGKFVTFTGSADTSGLVGVAYIEYVKV